MMKKIYILFILLVLAATAGAQNDTVNGYVCSQGVDASMWVTLDNPTIAIFNYRTGYTPINIGFDFLYFGQVKTWLRVSHHGAITFEYDSPPDLNEGAYLIIPHPQTLFPFGNSMNTDRILYQTMGTSGNRRFIIEFQGTYNLQVQLYENDNSIYFVYGPSARSGPNTEIMITKSWETYICMTAQHATNQISTNCEMAWPGGNHYYVFTPLPCLTIIDADIEYGSPTSVTMTLHSEPQAARYEIEYGTAGLTRGTGTVINTAQTQTTIDGLDADETYDFYITAFCADSLPGGSYYEQYAASCYLSDNTGNKIKYWDLYAPNVTCRYGTFRAANSIGIADYGYASSYSRHTVHSNLAESDPRTQNMLHTVPEGHCYSVRLGNWRNGGERESITYRLHIDTNNYDLLLLRYAIVEQNPSHTASEQPFFTFGVYDSIGNIINPCYYANFVAGDFSGWNNTIYNGSSLVWHDWQTVGFDLSSLHGRNIDVVLDNADCAQQGHFAYGYFTLESGTKHIKAAYCGATDINILRAPKGFAYRWYRDGDNTTLSTADSLIVRDEGRYFCEASYLLQNASCSILLSSYGGSRYPVAAFDIEPQNDCGSICRFANRSFVARDSLHTLPTSAPCDSYLWDFGDGTTSSNATPTHRFSPGNHTITLYAMLSNGQCIDSVTQTLHVSHQHDTIIDTLRCEPYVIEDTVITQAGTYTVTNPCGDILLHLYPSPDTTYTYINEQICAPNTFTYQDSTYSASGSYLYENTLYGCTELTHIELTVLPNYQFTTADTFQNGQSYIWRDDTYRRPGIYQDRFTTTAGCDSIYTLRLSCIERYDTLVCQDVLPLSWHGHTVTAEGADTLVFPILAGADSLVVLAVSTRKHPDHITAPQLHCDGIPYYSIPLSDTLRYTFLTDPYDPQILNLSRIIPSTTTLLIIHSDHTDEPSCPTSDTLVLDPLRPVVARLEVQPKWLEEGESDITATDRSKVSGWREWYVNNVLQESQEPTIIYHSDLQEDSVTVMLVIGIDGCADTAYTSVPVRHQDLIWFPNAFTPDRADNNIFRGYGINICNYDLHIFRRRGDCVFHTQEMEEGWDGTLHGVPLPQGSYAYMCTYATPMGEKRKAYGTVTLIR